MEDTKEIKFKKDQGVKERMDAIVATMNKLPRPCQLIKMQLVKEYAPGKFERADWRGPNEQALMFMTATSFEIKYVIPN